MKILDNLLQKGTQAEIRAYLIEILNKQDFDELSASQGLDTTALLHELNSRVPHENCSLVELAKRFRQNIWVENLDVKESFCDRLLLRCWAKR
ncbi:MAG: hypothetical protein QNJ70_20200 [Xenococcaceae cyanobacterium MO_207.B15]|nr:hypothetical protein [Xenococcaceae cyanobacterium MO_207.B15]